jgi:hypothetical protein
MDQLELLQVLDDLGGDHVGVFEYLVLEPENVEAYRREGSVLDDGSGPEFGS